MSELLAFSFGGLTFLALSLHESLSPLLLRLPPRLHLLLRHLLPLPLSLLLLLPLSSPLPALFLLFSVSGILSSLRLLPPLPPPLLDLILLSSFLLELLLLRLLPPSPSIHLHYFRLLSVPVLLCSATTFLSALRPRSPHPRLARALALALHGTWLIQTAFSLFSSAVAHGCRLHRKSWGDYTVTCEGHAAYHRAMALATLQFNCHLALLVVVAVALYWLVGVRTVDGGKYVALEEVSGGPPRSRYALVSEDEEDGVAEEGK